MNPRRKILKLALVTLEAGDGRPKIGLCAVIRSAGAKLKLSKEAESLTRVVYQRLGCGLYLQGWLYRHGYLNIHQFDGLYDTYREDCKALRAKLKATRIAWLKDLIKEHETCKPTKKSSPPSASQRLP